MSARITWPAYLGAAALYEVFRRLRLFRGNKATSLRELLASRSLGRQAVYRIPRSSSLADAANVMLAQRVDAVVVENNDDDTPVRTGVLHAACVAKVPLHSIPVTQALTPMEEACYVLPDNSVEDTLALLAACKQLHAPVLTDHPLHGLQEVIRSGMTHSEEAGEGHEAAPARLLAVVSLPELLGLTEAKRAERAKLWSERKSELMGMPQHGQGGGQGTGGQGASKSGLFLPLMM